MLVKEVDATFIDTLGNGLANLVRASPGDHVQLGPSVLGFHTRRGADKQVVLELALQFVLFNMVG